MTKEERIEKAARALLEAMERQYGVPVFSQNVKEAKDILRQLLPNRLEPADKSRA